MRLCKVLLLLLCCVVHWASTQDVVQDAVVEVQGLDAVGGEYAVDAQDVAGVDAQDENSVDSGEGAAKRDEYDAAIEIDAVDADPAHVQDAGDAGDTGPKDVQDAVDAGDTGPKDVQDAVDAGDTGPKDVQDAVDANDVQPVAGQDVAGDDEKDETETSSPPSNASTTSSEPREPPSSRSVRDWFMRGVKAFYASDWEKCVTSMENTILEWQYTVRANIDCRLRCGREARRAGHMFARDVEHLHYTEEMVRASLCLMRCKKDAFQGHITTDPLPENDEKALRDLKVYEYLQLCYYQALQFQKAASSVYTIMTHNPDNKIMKLNLEYYLSMSEVDPNNLVNYEAEPYVSLYFAGTEAYFSENYEAAVSNLEESLQEFLNAIERCRADCEGPFDPGWSPDFTLAVANQHVHCLKCKSKCHSKLSIINGQKFDDFIPLHYNYLQFAYFKLGQLKDACAAAATYLMFSPADETMLENIKYYKAMPKVEKKMFQPRQEAVEYIHRYTYEETLLKFVIDEFVFPDIEEKDELPPSKEIHDVENNVEGKETDAVHYSATREKTPNWEEHTPAQVNLKDLNTLLVLNRSLFNFQREGELGGEKRFVVDGVADKMECEELVQFAKMSGVRGDGYDGNKKPNSPLETFEGITLGRAALMVYFGMLELPTLHLFLNLSERAKNMVAAYFDISYDDLYFNFTHLVCRSAVSGISTNASSLSHQIHADNCWLQSDGRCEQKDPAYYWRDYSALLYLNDDFDGGEFIFSADPSGKLIQSSIKPTCGRLVGFSAGHENLHGVRGVKRGTRCALALWFTLDGSRPEWGRILTEEMIRYLDAGEQPNDFLVSQLESLENFHVKEAEKQKAQGAVCDDCREKEQHIEGKKKSVSLMKSNHTQH